LNPQIIALGFAPAHGDDGVFCAQLLDQPVADQAAGSRYE
jgi:hypothetical protein